jgi:hypothetical protein
MAKVTSIFVKKDIDFAIKLIKELSQLMIDLKVLVQTIMNECGCRFLGRLPRIDVTG